MQLRKKATPKDKSILQCFTSNFLNKPFRCYANGVIESYSPRDRINPNTPDDIKLVVA